ncbi:DUF6350 family protein [Pseudoscardovia radai]|uniref:cell division protein PerM n=1 Tax=Pseudoscardovia radai TaxID=987066 RepID=UPI00399634EC
MTKRPSAGHGSDTTDTEDRDGVASSSIGAATSAGPATSTGVTTSLDDVTLPDADGTRPSAVSRFLRGALWGLFGWFLPTFLLWLVVATCMFMFSMENTTSLTAAIMPVSAATVLTAQGVGVRYQFLDVSVIPLLATIIYLVSGYAFARRLKDGAAPLVGFAAVWVALDMFVYGRSPLTASDAWPVALGKFLVVALVVLVLAHGARAYRAAIGAIKTRVSAPLARTVDLSFRIARVFALVMATVGIVTFVVWLVVGFDAMRTVASFIGMGNASFWAAFVLSLLWMPDMCLWALSWSAGAGFRIGSFATFTMWQGDAHELPAIPIFGILPQPVPNATATLALESIPAVAAFLIAVAFMLSKKRIDIFHRRLKKRPRLASPRSIVDILLSFVTMCLSCIWIVVGCFIAFSLSCGSLGTERLAQLGVTDVAESTRALARPAAIGFFCAFLLMVIVSCIIELVTVLRARREAAQRLETDTDLDAIARTVRTSRSAERDAERHASDSRRVARSARGMHDGADRNGASYGADAALGSEEGGAPRSDDDAAASDVAGGFTEGYDDAMRRAGRTVRSMGRGVSASGASHTLAAPRSVREALDSADFPSESSLHLPEAGETDGAHRDDGAGTPSQG